MSTGDCAGEPVCINDFEQHAKKILPKRPWNYYSGGANALVTLQDSNSAFKRLRLRPRVLRDVSTIDTATTILGEKIEFPVCVSPTAAHKFAHPDGEVATARASYSAGTCMVLSSFNLSTIEEVARSSPQGIKWYHLHFLPDVDDNIWRIHRAENEGYKAIVLTVDDPYKGKDYLVARHGLDFPSHFPVRNAPAKYFKTAIKKDGGVHNKSHGQTWDVIRWIRSISKLPIVLKGILTAEDAKLAVQHGVDGIIVSNHGGRQLDTVPASIEALPEIVAAVDNQCEVYLDGGIRFGTDVFKALALGARAVFVGRPVLWGLAYQGNKGVYKVLQMLKEEFRLAMGLAGCASLKDISRDMVVHQSHYSRI